MVKTARPSGAKAHSIPIGLMYGLKPVPSTAADPTSGASGGAEFVEGGGEVGGKCVLGVGGEFVAMAGEIENVDSGLAFGIDESDLDIALVDAQSEGDFAEKAGDVLSHDLKQRRVG